MAISTGCAHRANHSALVNLPLPNSTQINCCWQSQEALEISIRGEQVNLSAVIAVEPASLTMVVLNPLGQRLLTIVQQGSQISTDISPAIPTALQAQFPVRQLLAGFHLNYVAPADWPLAETNGHIETGENSVGKNARKEQTRTLLHRDRPAIALSTDPENTSNRTLSFAQRDVSIKITTLSRTAL